MPNYSVAFGRVLSAIALTVMLASCSGEGTATKTSTLPGPDATGGTLIVSQPLDFVSLYPPGTQSQQDLVVIASVFDHLADIGDSLSTAGDAGFTPQLATGWKWAPDSLSIAFSINPRARWHDGQPVVAKDVQFTFRAYSDTSGSSLQPALVGNIDSVSIIDSLTPVVWFKRRSLRQFMEATYNMYVLPEHILGNVAPRDLPKHPFAKSPVGTGRFRFVKWDPGLQLQVVADTGNYRTRAKLDRVIWSISSTASSSAIAVFAGEADFYEKMSPTNLPDALKSPNVKVVPYSQVGYNYLQFNLHDRKNSGAPHPIFGDVRVRRALTLATDKVRLARIVLDTFATVGIGPSPRAFLRNVDSIRQYPFDLAHAKALLDSAGWIMPAGQTVRMKNGVPLAFEIYVQATSESRKHYATLLEEQYAAIGARVNARAVTREVLGPHMQSRDFDAYLGALGVTPGLPGAPTAWGSRGIANGNNVGGYHNPQFDALVDNALNASTASSANSFWIKAFDIINDDAPAIFLFEERLIAVMSKRIRPKTLRADAWYAYLADWTIDPSQRIARDKIGVGH